MVRLNLQLFAYKGSSIVDYLKSEGKDSSYSARKKLAASAGISNYTGTAAQNTKLLNSLRSGSSNTSTKKTTTNTKKTSNNTSNTTTSTKLLNGVDQATTDKMNSTYKESDDLLALGDKANTTLTNYENYISNKDIIDQSTKDALNQKFEVSDAYTQAMQYTQGLLEQLSSGRTSYTDQIKDLMGQIQNREDFEYDVDKDQLFQQALASAMGSGKTAMQDTIGQASALTGGYGSTYATSAGNQAYNSFIEDAYNNLPEYYQMALEAYQMEGQEMYQMLDMLNTADANEYQRMYNSWQANFDNAQQIWNQDFSTWEAGINQAYNSANLQLSEHSQHASDLYNLYSAAQEQYESKYAKEYAQWQDMVSQAQTYAQMLNTDWWNQTNFDENVRQYEQTFAENKRQFDAQLAEDQRQFNKTFSANYTSDGKGGYVSKSSSSGSSGSGSSGSGTKSPTETQMKKALEAYNTGGDDALNKYVDSLPTNIDIGAIDTYVSNYGELPLAQRTFTVIDDGDINWFGGVDNNAVVKDQYGNEYKLSDIKDTDKELAKKLSGLAKGKSYTAK